MTAPPVGPPKGWTRVLACRTEAMLRNAIFVAVALAGLGVLLWVIIAGDPHQKQQQGNSVSLADYGSFAGTTISLSHSEQPLASTVDAWLGIDYATQPIGDKRFRPVSRPSAFNGVRSATSYGKVCIQDPAVQSADIQDEACLNFNVFRTKDVPLDEKLPVLVWIHGGSFCTGGWRSYDGPSFVAASESPVMVVTFHYRLNSLGSLPSTLFEEEELLNLGIRDQRFFLEFVQEHIASFGGDPDRVTLGGQSAGAHAVGIQYFHNYGDDAGSKPLFARAIQQSGSVTARAFPNATYPLYAEQMKEYMQDLGCAQKNNSAAMACLRDLDVNRIRDVSTAIYRKYNRPLTWPFQPVQGGPLLEKFGSQSGIDETFFHVPIITSTTTDEGKLFIPSDIQTNKGFIDYLHNLSPTLTKDDLNELQDLYPDPATNSDSPYKDSPRSKQYNRLAAAYSDYAYICPGQETAYRTSRTGVPTWKVRFNTNNNFPPSQGIPHTADAKYAWGATDVQHPDISHVFHGYLASFVTAGDPNTARYPGSPEWPRYYGSDDDIEDVSEDQRQQLVVQPDDTKVEKDKIRAEECLYWRDPDRARRLDK